MRHERREYDLDRGCPKVSKGVQIHAVSLHSLFLRVSVATQTTYFFANRSPTARMSVTTASAPSRPVFAVSS